MLATPLDVISVVTPALGQVTQKQLVWDPRHVLSVVLCMCTSPLGVSDERCTQIHLTCGAPL